MTKAELKQIREERKTRHIDQLIYVLGMSGTFESLRRLEKKAHRAAEYYCNGEKYGQPYGEQDYNADTEKIAQSVAKLFGGALPDGFFVNGDPRGYALKIDDTVNTLNQRDWGGYGILAPDDDNF